MTPTPRLILASTSARRRLLLNERGFAHEAIAPTIDDSELDPPEAVLPHLWTASLAFLKARSVAESGGDTVADAIVLGADTIVVKNSRILGQPKTADEARSTLELLEGGLHTVMSGVAVLAPTIPGGRIVFTDMARVSVGPLGPARIEPYIASGGWRGKAGAYNLVERLGEGWPITYEGDPTTIMGLPMDRLTPILRRLLSMETTEAARS